MKEEKVNSSKVIVPIVVSRYVYSLIRGDLFLIIRFVPTTVCDKKFQFSELRPLAVLYNLVNVVLQAPVFLLVLFSKQASQVACAARLA